MSKYWTELTKALDPYVPGEQPKVHDLIKLNTNENPYPPSPKASAALRDYNTDLLRLYPDPNCDILKHAIAEHHHVDHAQVFVGNGSDEVLALAFMTFFKQTQAILFPDISYSFYPVYCKLVEIDYQQPPLDKNFQINFDYYHSNNGGIIFPNPNAPTGCLVKLEQIRQLLQRNTESVVIIDEAYIDFSGDFSGDLGGESAIALINEFPNLLVIQTFSKSRSLAGSRIGYAIGDANLIAGLERVKNSFNSYPLDSYALLAGVASLQDQDYFNQTCDKIIQTRAWLSNELQQLGFSSLPSATNFLFTTHPQHDAATLHQQLRDKKILVRYFNKPRIDQYLRITIGTQTEVEALVAALKKITL